MTDAFTLSLNIPYLNALREENNLPDVSLEGFGDLTVSAYWSPWRSETSPLSNLSFSVGIIFPTGESGNNPRAGITNPSVFQLGTGAYQGTLGLQHHHRIDDWTLATSANVILPLNESSKGFRPATTIFWSGSATHALSDTLSARLALNLSHGSRDKFQGIEFTDTGSTTLYLQPSLTWLVADNWSTSASYALPIYRRVDETAIAVGPIARIGMSYSF